MNVIEFTNEHILVDETPLDSHFLALKAQKAAAAFIAVGTSANTVRRYRSALTYWSAWLQLRHDHVLKDAPLPPAVAIRFVLDHLSQPQEQVGCATCYRPA